MERCHRGMVQEVGLEPTKPFRAADLQSAAIATMRPLHWNEDFLHQNPLWFMNFRHKQTATKSSFIQKIGDWSLALSQPDKMKNSLQ